MSFDIKLSGNILKAYFNSPTQRASGIPIDSLNFKRPAVSFQLMSDPVTYFNCLVRGDSLSGTFSQQGFSKGIIHLKRAEAKIKNYSYSDTAFSVKDHRITCRIYFPNSNSLHPALVFMHGSGPEGMFANQYYAEYLASQGIVTLIADKRGVGHSTGNWQKSTFEDLADDYVSAVKFLKLFKAVNASQIGIYGHSQGGTIAPLVASKSVDIKYIIAAASVGDSVYKQDIYRVENNMKADGFKGPALSKEAKNHKWIDWVEAPPVGHWIYAYYQKTGNYNSLPYWRLVKVPTFLIYGEFDQIEDIRAYNQNITASIKDNHHQVDLTTVILPSAQHNLTVEPGPNDKFFWWHASYGYEQLLASWILFRFRN